MRIAAIVQARMGSTRLPGKVLKPIGFIPMIEILLKRLATSVLLDEIVVATSSDSCNNCLVDHVGSLGYKCFQGSENDVLDRYLQAAKAINADVVVRLTGDCPLLDSALVDEVIRRFIAANVDYYSNISPPTYPDGLDVEVFTFTALEKAGKETRNSYDREHVTPYLRESGRFSQAGLKNNVDLSHLRWTVDESADFEVVTKIFTYFSPDIHFSWTKVLQLSLNHPEIFETNKNMIRNEGATMCTGQKLWKRAKQVIPGGNMLLSKRAEMFLPDQWPTYFSKAKGCRVWDLDGREFIDMSLMGIGTNTLGYGNPEVDEAVQKIIVDGNLSTLNCPEEVYLAERLVAIHPWAQMVRFGRTGGEANAIAIRIARAFSGKDKVAFCGYHGWHDWYLSANLGDDKNLAGHLLPGLEPKGVPQNLHGTVVPFNYNDLAHLEKLVHKGDVGVIMMEVLRNMEPEDNFLHKVRELATRHGIVLIFDECTSGFRQTFGGLHHQFKVEPDMAVLGKTLGNGYAITAVIGRRQIMQGAQSTFISSTFWTERIGPSAALKTLEVMQRVRSWEQITATGLDITARWKSLASKYGLSIITSGLPALTTFAFNSTQALAYKTLVAQEMLAKGYLASTGIYTCTEHTPRIVDDYFVELEPVFAMIKECEDGRDVKALLKGPCCHAGFRRLN